MSNKTTMNAPGHKKITIIGLGPMGQAMVRSYLGAGYSVTVWNRTKNKAEALEKEGAVRAETVNDALRANELIIVSLTEYSIMYKVFEGSEDALKGRTLVNLSSDTPEEARKAETWANGHGARFLSGGVMVDPPLVGKPEAFIFYSGSREVLETHQTDLAVLGRPDYRGRDAGLSQLYYQALLNILYTTAASVLQSMAMMNAGGVSASEFEPYVMDFLNVLPWFLEGMGAEVDSGKYSGEENSLAMMAAGAVHVAHTAKTAGTNTALTDLISELFQKTVANGHGEDGLASVIEVLKK